MKFVVLKIVIWFLVTFRNFRFQYGRDFGESLVVLLQDLPGLLGPPKGHNDAVMDGKAWYLLAHQLKHRFKHRLALDVHELSPATLLLAEPSKQRKSLQHF